MARGCIERTILFAQIAVANLDAVLQGNASTNGVHNVLRAALDGIREQLPAVTDAFTSDMRNHVLDLAHCAQVDGTMRIREVREIVVAIKVSLETVLGNLTIVERSANPSASGSAAGSDLNADREDDPDEEMVDATVGMDNGG
ncbi:hypothetical protein LEL_07259 [Akanthomyces lecanii RCEF 1005]|uniref:Uncharacterized protein n=1 Tax=Akanthomyces lecanii RCEF 1005 TaxID=1081108 RepID=A0A168FJG3_CORDF|nr:hypothetical protein LEL_07259 [Akanthomyces lecanii RCEF 1005]